MINLNKEQIIVWSELRESIRQFEFKCGHKVDLWDWDTSRDHDVVREEEMINWIKENANGKVYCNGDFVFLFEEESDAVAFKLRWV